MGAVCGILTGMNIREMFFGKPKEVQVTEGLVMGPDTSHLSRTEVEKDGSVKVFTDGVLEKPQKVPHPESLVANDN